MKFSIALAASLSLLPSALAHGWIKSITVDDGQSFNGPPTLEQSQTSINTPIRQITSNGPTTPDERACGSTTAGPASDVIELKPGAVLSIDWTDGGSPWLHALGPISMYMAKCDTTCDKFSTADATNAQWFKVAQLGFNGPQTWFQGVIQQGNALKFQLPTTLAQGDYLVRTEIIALHNNPAEIYPQCTQVRFTSGPSSGKVLAPSNQVLISNVYDTSSSSFKTFSPDSGVDASNYVFPGPALSNVAVGNEVQLNGGGQGSSGGSGGTTSGSGSGGSTSPSSSGSSGSGSDTGSDTASSSATSVSAIPAPSPSAAAAGAGNVNNGGSGGASSGSNASAPAAPAKTKSCKLRPRAATSLPDQEQLNRHRRRSIKRRLSGGH